jgi:hypothetical protein
MNEIECPYCHAQNSSEEITDPGIRYERQCRKCGKYYQVEVDWFPSYNIIETPCLNDESLHKWEPVEDFLIGAKTDYEKCSVCEQERIIP